MRILTSEEAQDLYFSQMLDKMSHYTEENVLQADEEEAPFLAANDLSSRQSGPPPLQRLPTIGLDRKPKLRQ